MKLFLGVVNRFFPWVFEEQINQYMHKNKCGILFSYWQFRRSIQKMIALGLHDFFSFDGPIIIDSGAYSALHLDQKISLEKYIKFLKTVGVSDNDLIVNLDVIGDRRESLNNWSIISQRIDYPVLPVVHFPTINLSDYSVPDIGLGGMVSSLKINEKGSVFDVAAWISKFRSLSGQNFHGFGLGSPFHQMAFEDFFKSIDWIGWRRNAAIGDCYTPEGSRSVPNIRKSKRTRKLLTVEHFNKYKPPFLEDFSLLLQQGNQGWINRALWNVWMFLNAQHYSITLEKSYYVRSIKKRMVKILAHNQARSLNYYFT